VICAGFSCRPPIFDPEQLKQSPDYSLLKGGSRKILAEEQTKNNQTKKG